MKVRMNDGEQALFAKHLGKARSFVEFGCGGSTVFAASHVNGPVISLDSSKEWIDQVAAACAKQVGRPQPKLFVVDIGPIGEWGRPVDDRFRERWPLYALTMWQAKAAADADLFLIDGRFRVSCFMETLLRCRPEAVVLIHDFPERKSYHVVREFADEIASCSALYAFQRRSDFAWRQAVR
ncbi:MAG: hypothetical protein ABR970_11010, partial [Roseiarcus sp.]